MKLPWLKLFDCQDNRTILLNANAIITLVPIIAGIHFTKDVFAEEPKSRVHLGREIFYIKETIEEILYMIEEI